MQFVFCVLNKCIGKYECQGCVLLFFDPSLVHSTLHGAVVDIANTASRGQISLHTRPPVTPQEKNHIENQGFLYPFMIYKEILRKTLRGYEELQGILVQIAKLSPTWTYLVQGQQEIPIREGGEHYTFYRIPAGQDFFYPSRDSPMLQNYLTQDTTSIRIRVAYYDIQGNRYDFPLSGYSEEIRF